jgi:hypothetical protein
MFPVRNWGGNFGALRLPTRFSLMAQRIVAVRLPFDLSFGAAPSVTARKRTVPDSEARESLWLGGLLYAETEPIDDLLYSLPAVAEASE